MEKRHFNRKRSLATAVAVAALAGFAHNTNAAVTFELTASGSTPGTGKAVSIASGASATLDVWATVTGTDGSFINDGLQIANLNFRSTGGTALGSISSPGHPTSPWNANGSSAGSQLDLDGDPSLATVAQ